MSDDFWVEIDAHFSQGLALTFIDRYRSTGVWMWRNGGTEVSRSGSLEAHCRRGDTESKTTISTCTRACDEFRTDLQRWTRHSGDGRLKWQNRANVGFFRQGQIKAMSEQLQNC